MILYHTENLNNHVFSFQFVFLTCKMLCNIISWGASDYSKCDKAFYGERETNFIHTDSYRHSLLAIKCGLLTLHMLFNSYAIRLKILAIYTLFKWLDHTYL